MTQHIRIDRRFAIIDEWVLDLDISDRAIRLYAVLARYADKDTHKAFPSRKTLAARLKCSPASVDRASIELVDAGLLQKEHRFNNSIVYTLVTSSPVQTPIIMGDDTLSSPVMRPIITADDLTRTTQLEPKELEPPKENETPKRETRLPQNWQPSQRLMDMFTTKWPNLDPDYEVEQFINYWHSVTKRKADWDLTFQVWMNKNQKDADKRGLVRGKRLTNNEQAALLAMKYREQYSRAELESGGNPKVAREIESEVSNWVKGVDEL